MDGREITAATILNTLWIDDSIASYGGMAVPGTVFGVLRESVCDVPVLSAIHLWIDLGNG